MLTTWPNYLRSACLKMRQKTEFCHVSVMGSLPRSVNCCRHCAKHERQLLRLASIAGQSKYGRCPPPTPRISCLSGNCHTHTCCPFFLMQNKHFYLHQFLPEYAVDTSSVLQQNGVSGIFFSRGFHTFCVRKYVHCVPHRRSLFLKSHLPMF